MKSRPVLMLGIAGLLLISSAGVRKTKKGTGWVRLWTQAPLESS